MADKNSKPQLRALTGVRFVAAFYVVIYHVALTMQMFDSPEGSGPFKDWCVSGVRFFNQSPYGRGLMESGPLAVSLFFTLSGFILTYTCLDQQNVIRVNRHEFWAARFARVYPVYFLGLIISLPGLPLWFAMQKPPPSPEVVWSLIAATLLLVQSWWPFAANVWNAPGWSLSVEAFFYTMFPWLAPYVDRIDRRALGKFLAGCWIASLIVPVIYWIAKPDGVAHVDWTTNLTWINVVKFNPLVRLPEFLFGMGLGKLFALRAAEGVHGVARGGRMSLLAFAALIGVMAVSDFVPHELMHNGLTLPIFGALIYGLALGGGPLAWILSRRLSVLLGDASYAMYILHYTVILIAIIPFWLGLGGFEEIARDEAKKKAEARATAGDSASAIDAAAEEPLAKPLFGPEDVSGPFSFYAWAAGLSILSSVIVHKLFELPMRRLVRRLLSPRKVVPTAEVLPDLP